MIRVLTIDDSESFLSLLQQIIDLQPDMQVVGNARNGLEGIKLVNALKPDLITMDTHLPIMDGYTATRQIMMQNPTPIVMVTSSFSRKDLDLTFKALDAGALCVLSKLKDIDKNPAALRDFITTLRAMAEIKVIKRRFPSLIKNHMPITTATPSPANKYIKYEVIAIGASVGGPQALKQILSQLPSQFPLPIAVVQHMMTGFIGSYAQWLNDSTQLKVKIVEDMEPLIAGTVYFAPDDLHFLVKRNNDVLTAKLEKGPCIDGFCPSITALFKSIAKVCENRAVGVILTGMGSDGAAGLFDLKKSDSHTIIQDAETAVVFGMAGVAQEMGAVEQVVQLNQMAEYLIEITQQQRHS